MSEVNGLNTEEQLEQVEIGLEQAKFDVDMMRALQKLRNNDYFKKLFMTEYLEKYPVRLVMLKAHPSQQKQQEQLDILNQIDGIGQFKQFLVYIMTQGRMSEKAIEDFEDTREVLQEEEAS